MRIWLALIIAPSIVLTCLSVNYMLVGPSCHLASQVPLDGVSIAGFAACALATLSAGLRWRDMRVKHRVAVDSPARQARASFMAAVATGVGSLSCVALVAISLPQWILPAC